MSAAQYYNGGQPQQDRGYQPGPPLPPPPSHQQYGQQPSGGYSMNASQPYAPPSSQPYPSAQNNTSYAPSYGQTENGNGQQYTGDTAPFSQANEKTGARFKPKTRLNDPIFLVLFIASFAGFCAVSALAISTFINQNGLGGGFGQDTGGQSATLDYHTVYLLLIVSAIALVIAAVYLMIVRAFTSIIIPLTMILTVILNIGICIYYFIIKYYSGAIIFVVIALLSAFFYWTMRRRIPLARLLLQTTMDITKHHPVVYLIVLLGLILQTAWSIWYAFTCVAIYVRWTPGSPSCGTNSCSSGKVAGLIFFATFVYYWTSQVIANVILCTLSGGIFGGWYYYGPRAENSGLPKRASLKAFVRASTLSLGSIAFGSLIVTILELLRLIIQAFSQYEAGQGDMVGAIIGCCAACCVGCIQSLVEYFNKYAYIEISLYGKAYIPAAKDTWRLLKDRGIDALVNDSLVGTTLMWGAYINGFLCAVFGYIYLRYTNPAYNDQGQYSAPIILYSFLIGLNIGFTLSSAIESGVSTIFVGLGEDPMVLQQRSPGLFELIRQTYPQVVQGVPRN
ncbi:plasma-membrane choline transporter-domain-containing protein [Kockovaella imperatae]|uniref:Protein PNS1 n=1 Tax=Kockovaella imperatae TaxID=4999 RepID=A0A1Y1UFQ5_9TREE|nr:plasma-membrane choline transporter-domain-containing protein [Kockovaella imperatae]ORX36900.1 plasma-membrane choline transporter-domain-containing protein [Kockovaella imperatae]